MPRRSFNGVRRFRKSSSRARFNRRWFGVLAEGNQPISSFTATPLIQPDDYRVGNLKAEGTVLAVYANLDWRSSTSAVTEDAIAGILVVDSDIATTSVTNDVDDATNLTNERWLWNARRFLPASFSGTVAQRIHIKQRVKLEDFDMRLVTSNSDGVVAYDWTFDCRILVATR